MARMKQLAETAEENAEVQGEPEQTFAGQPQDETEAASTPAGADPWDALDNPVYVQAFARGSRVDVVAQTPEKIRKAVDAAHADYWDASEDGENPTPQFRAVTFPTAGHADEFVKLARRYAQLHPDGRFALKSKRSKADPCTVQFAAVPYRARVPKFDGTITEDVSLAEPPF
jgi:hypothetical protein